MRRLQLICCVLVLVFTCSPAFGADEQPADVTRNQTTQAVPTQVGFTIVGAHHRIKYGDRSEEEPAPKHDSKPPQHEVKYPEYDGPKYDAEPRSPAPGGIREKVLRVPRQKPYGRRPEGLNSGHSDMHYRPEDKDIGYEHSEREPDRGEDEGPYIVKHAPRHGGPHEENHEDHGRMEEKYSQKGQDHMSFEDKLRNLAKPGYPGQAPEGRHEPDRDYADKENPYDEDGKEEHSNQSLFHSFRRNKPHYDDEERRYDDHMEDSNDEDDKLAGPYPHKFDPWKAHSKLPQRVAPLFPVPVPAPIPVPAPAPAPAPRQNTPSLVPPRQNAPVVPTPSPAPTAQTPSQSPPAAQTPKQAEPDQVNKATDKHSYSIGLWGDLPYSAMQAVAGVPNLIADMNKHDLAFTVLNGDWKAGHTGDADSTRSVMSCVDTLYKDQLPRFLNSLKAPAMYTPGSSEWADCDSSRSAFGHTYHALNRLTLIRELYFDNNPFSFGQQKLKQDVQTETCLGWEGTNPSDPTPGGPYKYMTCSENRRWMHGGVVYATLSQVGSCNNLCDRYPDATEWAVRNAANIRWLKDAFATAKAKDAAAVMIIAQADPDWDRHGFQGGNQRDPMTLKLIGSNNPDGYHDFMVTLRSETMAFKKPVVYVHSDKHYFVIDKPLLDTRGARLLNFTRVMTFGDDADTGSNDANWLKVDVNPNSPSVFTWTPMAVTSNSATPVSARIASTRPGLARPQPAASQATRLSAQSKSV